MRFRLVVLAMAILLAQRADAQDRPVPSELPARSVAGPAQEGDPHLWLEETSSSKALEWVRAHNVSTINQLEKDPRYAILYREGNAIATAKDRIPSVSFVGDELYNFWRDDRNLRGMWRRTTLSDYESAEPSWTPLLDIDALGKKEGKSWVSQGASCLKPGGRRCLVALSNGGEDAVEVREYDLDKRGFVEGGFFLPRGKLRYIWEDADHLLVGREWTPGELTASGYPFVLRRVTRGQLLEAAQEVFRGEARDVSAWPSRFYDDQGGRLVLVHRGLDYFRQETYVLTANGPRRLPIPDTAFVVDLIAGRVIVRLRRTWVLDGASFVAGSLVQLDLAAVMRDSEHPRPSPVWTPSAKETLEGVRSSRDRLLLTTLENVRGRAWTLRPDADGSWERKRLELPDNLSISFGSGDDDHNRAFVFASGFLTPSSMWLVDTETGALRLLKTLPARFDASNLVVEQFEAVSSDGTPVPYFVVRRRDIKYDGSTPTYLTAYGGFGTNQTPGYNGSLGKQWLERGGAYVLANIRGGGEFGPAWHEAGIGTKRQLVYDDFTAVARDLIARKVTSPRRLGISGVSNGGLLMGMQFTQHPELWNAVVISVPLLDMLGMSRIGAGSSWVAEYGDVDRDPAVRTFWQKTSPYQNLKAGVAYPEPFLFTTTKDDRVGPQHARKFAARLEEMKVPFLYYENIEGGHGTGADSEQSSRTWALIMTYLMQKLVD